MAGTVCTLESWRRRIVEQQFDPYVWFRRREAAPIDADQCQRETSSEIPKSK